MCQETYNIFFFQTSLSTTVYYTPNTSPRVKLYKQMDHARVHTVIHVIYVCQYKNVDSHMLPF